ncbi:hypothetical protein GEMRC1_004001 [Eukaryota sp. GEM-RC1]
MPTRFYHIRQLDHLRTCFSSFDDDKDDLLTPEQTASLLQSCNAFYSNTVITDYFAKDSPLKVIDFDSFCSIYEQSLHSLKLHSSILNYCKQIDRQKTGFLNVQDFCRLLSSYGLSTSSVSLISEFATGGDEDLIAYTDFLDFMMEA